MTRVLVITSPEKGHYHPLLGPAIALARRGAEVAFACAVDIEEELHEAGVARVLTPPGAARPSAALRGAALARLLGDRAGLAEWIRELLIEAPARQVEAMRAVVRDFRPDVIAIDTMSYEGAIAAELEEVPWVGWATSLNPVVPEGLTSDLLQTLRGLDRDRMALFSSYGLRARFRVSDVLSPRGTAVFTTAALVGPAADPDVVLVGPSLGGSRRGEVLDPRHGDGRPLLYVSFGSQAWHQPQRFDRVLEAAARLDLAVFAAMGDLAEDYERRGLPPQVRCVPVADQLVALRRARVLITHGGANSVMESLAHGVPLLISPLCNDQPHNRYFVERAGAGLGIDLDRCSVADLTTALSRLCADGGSERAAAARVAASYAQHVGDEGAAALVWRQRP